MIPSSPFAALLGLSCAAGCSGQTTTKEPVYEGCATDENWRTFDEYETTSRVQVDQTLSPRWNAPPADGMLDKAAPTWFAWQPSATQAGQKEGTALCATATASATASMTTRSAKAGPTSSASPDHLPPVSGDVYDIHVTVDGVLAYRVMTTRQTFLPPPDLWASWAGKRLSVDLIRAQLLKNDVQAGPYQAVPLAVQVTP